MHSCSSERGSCMSIHRLHKHENITIPGSWMKAWQDQKDRARAMSFWAEVMFITCSDGSRSTCLVADVFIGFVSLS